MAVRVLGLPLDIPWKVIAVSPDMIDVLFCNKSSRLHGARRLPSRYMSHPTKICLTGCVAAWWPSSRSLARSRATKGVRGYKEKVMNRYSRAGRSDHFEHLLLICDQGGSLGHCVSIAAR